MYLLIKLSLNSVTSKTESKSFAIYSIFTEIIGLHFDAILLNLFWYSNLISLNFLYLCLLAFVTH